MGENREAAQGRLFYTESDGHGSRPFRPRALADCAAPGFPLEYAAFVNRHFSLPYPRWKALTREEPQ